MPVFFKLKIIFLAGFSDLPDHGPFEFVQRMKRESGATGLTGKKVLHRGPLTSILCPYFWEVVMSKFYENGLRFECTGCGACCRLPGGRVEISEEEARVIAAHLQLSLTDFIKKYCLDKNGGIELKDNELQHCIFLVNDRCAVYEARPLQCRTFPFWPENLKSEYRWNQLSEFCPGVNTGILHSDVEITEIRKSQKTSDRKRREVLLQEEIKD